MTIQLDFWHMVSLLLMFLSFVFGAAKLLLSEVDRRLSGRFEAMEDARAAASQQWEIHFSNLRAQIEKDSNGWQQLERDFLRFQADLPLSYVLRTDYIRGQTIIETKLDSLALKIENAQLRGI